MENTTTQFNERVQTIFHEMQKGIPEKEILMEYNNRWNMPLAIMNSYFAEAKKLLAPPPPEGGIEGKDEAIGTDGNMQSVMPSPLGEGKDRANLHNIMPSPKGEGKDEVNRANAPQPLTPTLSEIPPSGELREANRLMELYQKPTPAPQPKKEKKSWKLSHEKFFKALRENGGIFSATAKAIRSEHKIQYTRQSVRERAMQFPEELVDIRAEFTDFAQFNLLSYIKQQDDKKLALKASTYILDRLMKCNGASPAGKNKGLFEWNDNRIEFS